MRHDRSTRCRIGLAAAGLPALFALLGGSVALPLAAAATTAQAFSDDLCPDATPAGRRLNALNAQTSPPENSDLVAANASLVTAYRSCAVSFDAETRQHNADQTIDSIIIGRVYARLQEARSLRRAGEFATQLHDIPGARVSYDRALGVIDEIGGIASASNVMMSGGNVLKLVTESRTLRSDVTTARAALDGPTPSPSPQS